MSLDGLHRAMLDCLDRNYAAAQQIEEYGLRWRIAMANNGAIPCPRCHLRGILARLSPRSTERAELAASRCEVCGTIFQYPAT
jgi:hypothetical protein